MKAKAKKVDEELEVLGIVISRGSHTESEPRFSAYVWSAGPDSELEAATVAA